MPPRPLLPADDLYTRLELPVDATFEAVEVAWRALLKRHHPDVAGGAADADERANASLKERGSLYRISEIGIGAAIPPSVTFTIARVDDAEAHGLVDSSTLLAADATKVDETIVSLDGVAVQGEELEELQAQV